MRVRVVAFAAIGVAIMYGVMAGLMKIRDTLKVVSARTYGPLDMDAYFMRGIRVLCVVSVTRALGVLAIVALVFSHI